MKPKLDLLPWILAVPVGIVRFPFMFLLGLWKLKRPSFMRIWLILFCFSFCANATIITDTNRVIPWDPGVRGGIPRRTSIATTLPAGSTAAQINSALNSAGSNQVVLLSAGGYNLTANVYVPSYKSLRGAGSTTILTNAGGHIECGHTIYGDGIGNPTSFATITGGNTRGSKSITVNSTAGISIGDLLMIVQSNASFVVASRDSDGYYCGWCDGSLGGFHQGQMVTVTNAAGSTLAIDPPLYFPYTNSPRAYKLGAPTAIQAGVEDLRMYATPTGSDINFGFYATVNCWGTNVESDFCTQDHVRIEYALWNDFVHSYVHDAFDHGPGNDKMLVLRNKATACKIENNIFSRCHVSVMLEWGAAGNVIAYNYSTNNYHEALGWCINDFDVNHGAFPQYNLIEGNVGIQYRADATWGGSGWFTFLRNWAAGDDYYYPPYNARTGTNPPAQWEEGSGNNMAFAIDTKNLWVNMIGNMAGSQPWLTYALANSGGTLRTNSPGGSKPNLYKYNFQSDNQSLFVDAQPFNTAIHHANWGLLANAQQFDSTIADHVVPNSYYLSGKPAWYNGVWPPVDPANPTRFAPTNIPAGYRFYYTNEPASSGPDITPPVITNFTVSVLGPNTASVTWQTDETVTASTYFQLLGETSTTCDLLTTGTSLSNYCSGLVDGKSYTCVLVNYDSNFNYAGSNKTFATPAIPQGQADVALGIGVGQ